MHTVLPTLVGGGRLQPPFSLFYHLSSSFDHLSQLSYFKFVIYTCLRIAAINVLKIYNIHNTGKDQTPYHRVRRLNDLYQTAPQTLLGERERAPHRRVECSQSIYYCMYVWYVRRLHVTVYIVLGCAIYSNLTQRPHE